MKNINVAYCNVNRHLLRTIFSTCLTQKRNHSLSHKFHADVQTQTIITLWCIFSYILYAWRAWQALARPFICGMVHVQYRLTWSPFVYRLCQPEYVQCNHWLLPISEWQRPLIKSQLYVEDLSHLTPVLILLNWLRKPGEWERMTETNFWYAWDSNQTPLGRIRCSRTKNTTVP